MNLFSSFIDNIEQQTNDNTMMDVVNDKRNHIFQIINNVLGDREDNASVESDASDEGFVLLEEFPCTECSENNSIFSRFNVKRSFIRNLDDSIINSMDVDQRNTPRSSNKVKHAILNSDQLELFKRCTRPDLSTSANLVRERALDIENLEKEIRWASPMHILQV